MQNLTHNFLPFLAGAPALGLQDNISLSRDLPPEILEFKHEAPRRWLTVMDKVPLSIGPKRLIFNTKMVLPIKKIQPQNNGVKRYSTSKFYADFCQRLRRLREHQEWSQQQMAKLIGIPMANYQKYEQGKRRMPLDVVAAVSRVTGESMDVLLTGKLPDVHTKISRVAWDALKKEQREVLIRDGYVPETPRVLDNSDTLDFFEGQHAERRGRHRPPMT